MSDCDEENCPKNDSEDAAQDPSAKVGADLAKPSEADKVEENINKSIENIKKDDIGHQEMDENITSHEPQPESDKKEEADINTDLSDKKEEADLNESIIDVNEIEIRINIEQDDIGDQETAVLEQTEEADFGDDIGDQETAVLEQTEEADFGDDIGDQETGVLKETENADFGGDMQAPEEIVETLEDTEPINDTDLIVGTVVPPTPVTKGECNINCPASSTQNTETQEDVSNEIDGTPDCNKSCPGFSKTVAEEPSESEPVEVIIVETKCQNFCSEGNNEQISECKPNCPQIAAIKPPAEAENQLTEERECKDFCTDDDESNECGKNCPGFTPQTKCKNFCSEGNDIPIFECKKNCPETVAKKKSEISKKEVEYKHFCQDTGEDKLSECNVECPGTYKAEKPKILPETKCKNFCSDGKDEEISACKENCPGTSKTTTEEPVEPKVDEECVDFCQDTNEDKNSECNVQCPGVDRNTQTEVNPLPPVLIGDQNPPESEEGCSGACCEECNK